MYVAVHRSCRIHGLCIVFNLWPAVWPAAVARTAASAQSAHASQLLGCSAWGCVRRGVGWLDLPAVLRQDRRWLLRSVPS
jgi:hypothetical protein